MNFGRPSKAKKATEDESPALGDKAVTKAEGDSTGSLFDEIVEQAEKRERKRKASEVGPMQPYTYTVDRARAPRCVATTAADLPAAQILHCSPQDLAAKTQHAFPAGCGSADRADAVLREARQLLDKEHACACAGPRHGQGSQSIQAGRRCVLFTSIPNPIFTMLHPSYHLFSLRPGSDVV
jgi:hypothetical protein